MKKVAAFVVSSGLWVVFQAGATPAQVVIIRHGEKPAVGNQVTPQGCERAYSLPRFFDISAAVNAYGRPVAIYAQTPNKDDGSIRPSETVAPTAAEWGLNVNSNYTHKQYQAMADEILSSPDYDGKTVVIAWEHDAIPDLAQALGAPNSAPSDWPGDVFDQAWILNYNSGSSLERKPIKPGVSASLSIVPEYVLPTDNPAGGSDWTAGPQTPQNSSPQVSAEIQNECVNNDSLNAIVRQVSVPSLPDSVFSDTSAQ